MASGFNVDGISDYIKENGETLIASAIIGRTPNYTLDRVSKRFGVKCSENIHTLDIVPTLQDGVGCGFSADGKTEFAERLLTTAVIKVNDEWCPDDLLCFYAENQVAIAAGKERLPFEQEITSEIVDGVADQVERIVWQGDSSDGDLIDGYLTIAAGADSASTNSVEFASGATAYDKVLAMYMALDEDVLNARDAFIAVSPADFRAYIQDLVKANLYHYDPANGAINEMFIPGADIKVVKVKGLAGSDKMYASTWRNLVAGMDMMNDKEEFKLWFSDDDDVFKLKLRFNLGVTTYFPDKVWVGAEA